MLALSSLLYFTYLHMSMDPKIHYDPYGICQQHAPHSRLQWLGRQIPCDKKCHANVESFLFSYLSHHLEDDRPEKNVHLVKNVSKKDERIEQMQVGKV
jgi:hypothetical protein